MGGSSTSNMHLPKLQSYIDGLLKDWRVPVLSVALVKREDGKLASEIAHFGEQADGREATDETLYNLGSVSKSFVAFAVAILVDEGKVKWDSKVREVVPEFKVMDEKVSTEATILDLLAHRCGTTKWQAFAPACLAQQTAADTLRTLAFSEQSAEFRNSLVYSNAMFAVLGEVISRLSSQPFIDFFKTRIFDSLGMSTATYKPEPSSVAAPAISRTQDLQQIGLMTQWIKDANDSAFHAPGGIFMSTRDAIKWLSFLVDRTRPSSAPKLVSNEQLKVIFSTHNDISLGFGMIPPVSQALQGIDVQPVGYCAALNKCTYQNHTLYDHPGNFAGVAAQFTLAPQDGVAIMAFTTCAWTGNAVASMATFRLLEDILGLEKINWDERLRREEFFISEEAPTGSQYEEVRKPENFLRYCGLYETNKGNRALITCSADPNVPEIGRNLLEKIESSVNLHPYQEGFLPQLYLLSPDEPHLEFCTTYLALIPTSESTFRAQARTQTRHHNKVLDMQKRSIVASQDGDLSFKLNGLEFKATAPDVGCIMRKVS